VGKVIVVNELVDRARGLTRSVLLRKWILKAA